MKNILLEINNGIAVVTLNRPDQLNALNRETILELSGLLDNLNNDKSVRALILTGAGEKAFVAGADIKEFAHFNIEEGRALSADGQTELFNKLENMSKPCIAAINGYALGGGLELAMACHIRVANTNAKLGLPEVSLGVIPGYGGTQRLTRLVGMGKALEMICTAGMIDADDALAWGLVNHVTSPEELMVKATDIATKISRQSSSAITQALHAVRASYQANSNGFQAEVDAFGACFGTPDFIEGTSAFMERRKPDFSTK
jgi:enoyl-CoA hydratase